MQESTYPVTVVSPSPAAVVQQSSVIQPTDGVLGLSDSMQTVTAMPGNAAVQVMVASATTTSPQPYVGVTRMRQVSSADAGNAGARAATRAAATT